MNVEPREPHRDCVLPCGCWPCPLQVHRWPGMPKARNVSNNRGLRGGQASSASGKALRVTREDA